MWDPKKITRNIWLSIADLPAGIQPEAVDSKEYISDLAAEKARRVERGTLLVSFKLTLGRLAYAGRDLFTNEAIAALTINDESALSQAYLYWYLTFFDWAKYAELDEKLKGKTLNKAKLKVLPVFLPPPAEQERIVAILNEAFEAIATATANTEKVLANARGLFESERHYSLARTTANWERRDLGDVCENLDRLRVPITKSKRVAGPIPYYGASGVVDYVADHLFDEDLLLVSEDGANLLARTYPIAFSISGKSWVNNHAHVLRFDTDAQREYVERYLNSISLAEWVSGMAQPKLNQRSLNSIPVPWTDDHGSMQRLTVTLSAVAKTTGELSGHANQKLALLAGLKRSILNKAFSGELTAVDRELSKAGV